MLLQKSTLGYLIERAGCHVLLACNCMAHWGLQGTRDPQNLLVVLSSSSPPLNAPFSERDLSKEKAAQSFGVGSVPLSHWFGAFRDKGAQQCVWEGKSFTLKHARSTLDYEYFCLLQSEHLCLYIFSQLGPTVLFCHEIVVSSARMPLVHFHIQLKAIPPGRAFRCQPIEWCWWNVYCFILFLLQIPRITSAISTLSHGLVGILKPLPMGNYPEVSWEHIINKQHFLVPSKKQCPEVVLLIGKGAK